MQQSLSGSSCMAWWRMPYMEVALTIHLICECWYPTWSSASTTSPSLARLPRPLEQERKCLGCRLVTSPSLSVRRYIFVYLMFLCIENILHSFQFQNRTLCVYSKWLSHGCMAKFRFGDLNAYRRRCTCIRYSFSDLYLIRQTAKLLPKPPAIQ